eukprot:628061-Pyramimonas_sp.AAC.1
MGHVLAKRQTYVCAGRGTHCTTAEGIHAILKYPCAAWPRELSVQRLQHFDTLLRGAGANRST